MQSESLLRIITLAAEQQLPMAPLLRAFAKDQKGFQRRRIQHLAMLIDEGVALPSALEQTQRLLPVESVLAIRFGTESGALAKTLRSQIEDAGQLQNREMNERLHGLLVYPAFVTFFIAMIVTFLLIYIWPVFNAIMSDFGMAIESRAFQAVSYFGEVFVNYWWLVAVLWLIVVWVLWTENPGRALRRILLRPWFDTRSADVLQSLSTISDAGRPILGAISTLARYHHDPTLRQKLLFVCNEVEHGAELWTSLQTVKLLSPEEVTLIEVSEKVGNRPWAMAQLANLKRTRIQGRLEMVRQLIEPMVIVVLGGIVLTICLACFAPFFKLMLLAN